jgi:ABC-type tungstate transport system permease subunit
MKISFKLLGLWPLPICAGSYCFGSNVWAVRQAQSITMASTTSTEQSGLFGTCCPSSRRPAALM